MKRTLISTLICTYNAVDFFDATIRSVLDQTYTDQEILIRDDCSTDGTVELLKQRAKKDTRIKLFIEPGVKRGPYGGLNYLLDHAQGDYIAIQDHDDIWHPEKLEKQIITLEKNVQHNACGSFYIERYEKHDRFLILETSVGNPAHTSLVLRSTDLRYNTALPKYNDKYFMDKLTVVYVKCPLVIHRIKHDGGNLSLKRDRSKSIFDYRRFQNNQGNITLHSILRGICPSFVQFLSIHFFSRKKYLTKRQVGDSNQLRQFSVYL